MFGKRSLTTGTNFAYASCSTTHLRSNSIVLNEKMLALFEVVAKPMNRLVRTFVNKIVRLYIFIPYGTPTNSILLSAKVRISPLTRVGSLRTSIWVMVCWLGGVSRIDLQLVAVELP